MKRLSIRLQLAIIVGLSLLPIALLGFLFVNQSNKEIAFGQKEIVGTIYLEALLPDLIAMTAGQNLPLSDAFDDVRTRFDATLDVEQLAKDYASIREGGDFAARSTALNALIARVGDTSNLILDPDLDSYYVMDIILLKMPAAANAVAELLDRIEVTNATTDTSTDNRIALTASLRGLEATISGAASSLAASIAGNPDGRVAANLTAPVTAYSQAVSAFAATAEQAMKDFAKSRGLRSLITQELRDAQRDAEAASLTAADAAATELKRLLEARVSGFSARLNLMLACAAALVGIVFAASWFFSRSIVAGLKRLETGIRSLAEGDGDGDIGGLDGKDEISAISRAVAHLRERIVARQEEANQAKLDEQAALEVERRKVEAEKAMEAERKVAEAAAQGRVVETLKQALLQLADGDLGSTIQHAFPGEMDAIRVAFNTTVTRFADVVSQLRQTSHGVKTATAEILTGANDLSDRTTKQAATVEETSAAMEQLAATVAENARKAGAATEKTQAASRLASEGGEVMRQANTAMEQITQSSSKISSIIGMIDDIAFQTNLLALNASVEAARAGEAGKGFAVVAIEVRRLAQSAADASSEVKALIEQSASEVAGGTRLVADAAGRLTSLLQTVEEFDRLMREIARESQEQAAAIAEVNTAVRQMDEMTQHNAALVEETNAAIEQTENQAAELDRIVEVFTFGKSALETRAA